MQQKIAEKRILQVKKKICVKNIFVDANVLIAVCNREYPNAIYASMLLSLVEKPSFRLFTSPLCMAILFYYAEKKSGYDQAKKKMLAITKNLHFTDHIPQILLLFSAIKKYMMWKMGYSIIQLSDKTVIILSLRT